MFAERLTSLRKKHKLTHQQMADYLGITRPAYTAYESGSRRPNNQEMLKKLAIKLDVTVDYLIGSSDLPHMTASESKSLRTIKDIRREIENDEILDVDGKPFSPERKTDTLRQLDLMIRIKELQLDDERKHHEVNDEDKQK